MSAHELVEQLMTKRAVSVRPDQHLFHAYSVMQRCGIRHLPVVDQGELVGLLSDRDLYRHGFLCDEAWTSSNRFVRDAMTRGVRTCRPTDRIEDVAGRMLRDHGEALPVVNEQGTLVGIITSTDLLRHLRGPERPDAFQAAVGMAQRWTEGVEL